MSVFVDTSAWYALWNEKDQDHQRAVEIYSRLKETAETLVTNNLVLTESVALVANRMGWAKARIFCGALTQSAAVKIHYLTQEQFTAICDKFRTFSGQASLVDCSAFLTMESQKIRRAFAFDRDFRKAGFILLE